MRRGPDWTGRQRLFCGAITVALLLSTAACTAAQLPSAANSTTDTTSSTSAPSTQASALPTAEASSVVTPAADAAATLSYVTDPPATPTAAPVALSSVSPLASGKWTSIHWTHVATPPAFALVSANPLGFGGFKVFGWSRGYVAFDEGYTADTSSNTSNFRTFSSTDGVHWQSGQVVTFGGSIYISGVVEGPAGLLAVGTYIPGVCGGSPDVAAVWRSTDGATWRQVAVFSVDAGDIDGGSAGYIATGNLSRNANAAWVSSDGANWKHVDLTADTFKGVQVIESGTAFAGGYVMAGAALGEPSGCGGGQAAITGALWWSADGTAWSRDSLSGTTPGDEITMSVSRINDHALLASESSYASSTEATVSSYWTSTDGRTWRSASPPSTASSYPPVSVLTNSKRGLELVPPSLVYGVSGFQTGQVSPSQIYAFDDDLSLVKLAQTGDTPDDAWANESTTQALGPTGLVVMSSDGSSLWLGVPGS